MKEPKVIHPADFDLAAEYERVGEDIGICDCPACGEHYAHLGNVQECTRCGFQFPVDWWSQYSKGCQDGVRVLIEKAPISGGMRRRCEHPYYRYGFENPAGDPLSHRRRVDWRSVMDGVEPKSGGMLAPRYSYCRRCGNDKPPPRHSSTKLCVECDAETSCVHYQPERPMADDYVCAAGVHVCGLTGTEPGCGNRRPCYYIEGGKPVKCDKFQASTIEQMHAEDAEWEKATQEFLLVGPLVRQVKEEQKGKDWKGQKQCPVCGGVLTMTHAASNSHVWGNCAREGCLAWME